MTTFLTALTQWLPQAAPVVVMGLLLWWRMNQMEKRMDRMESHWKDQVNGMEGHWKDQVDRVEGHWKDQVNRMETGLIKMDNHFREDMKELRGVLVQALARDSITAP